MAKIYGGRSKYLVKNDVKLFTLAGLVIPLFALVICILIFRTMLNISNLKGNSYVILIASIVFILAVKRFINTTGKDMRKTQKWAYRKSDKYNRGWRGEEVILDVLKTLSDNYTIFYDVNLYNKGNIDFVLSGPCGLLAIEVKSHIGKITFANNQLLRNGHPFKEKDILKQALKEALDLHDYLKETAQIDLFVTPVLVFSNKHAFVRFGLNPINNIFVIQKEYLIKLIESLPEAISRQEATEIEQELSLLYK